MGRRRGKLLQVEWSEWAFLKQWHLSTSEEGSDYVQCRGKNGL